MCIINYAYVIIEGNIVTREPTADLLSRLVRYGTCNQALQPFVTYPCYVTMTVKELKAWRSVNHFKKYAEVLSSFLILQRVHRHALREPGSVSMTWETFPPFGRSKTSEITPPIGGA